MILLPILSTAITFVFALAVLNRYRHKRGTYLLLWGIGLVLYGLGTGSEVILSRTYSEVVLKLWYLTGAMLTAAWLGQGTIHLLVRKRGIALTLTVVLTIVSVISAILVFTAPVTAAAASYDTTLPASEQYKEILVRSGWVTMLTIVLNIYGTIALVGGALYSAFLFWRKQVLFDRMIGNILIAAGALMPAMAGTFVKAGLADWLYLSELLGAALMYIGFLRATAGKPVGAKQTVPVTSGD